MRKRLAIVGAGPAGLTAALAARQQGLDVEVFEQAPDFRRVGAGIFIHSNGLRVLDTLGLLESLAPRIRMSQVFHLEAAGGGRLTTFDYRSIDVPHNRGGVMLRADLQELLLTAALRAGVPVRFGRRCVDAAPQGAGAGLRFADGSSIEADAVIAADGINSRAREGFGLKVRKRPTGSAWLRGVAPVRPPDEGRELLGNDGRTFGLQALPGDRTYFFCSAPPSWTGVRGQGLAEWIEGWSAFGPDVMAVLGSVEDWGAVNHDEVHQVEMKRWHAGPAFVVGDAAHAMPPNFGQGANSAMVDALVLMRLLGPTLDRGGSLDEAGRAYEDLRRRFVGKIQALSLRMCRMEQWRSAPARTLRRLMFKAGDSMRFLSRPYEPYFVGWNERENFAFQPPRSNHGPG